MLSIFLILGFVANGQNYSPDYFANYWIVANARSMGMGKVLSAAREDASMVLLGPTSASGFSGISISGGGAQNPFPELGDGSVFGFSMAIGGENGFLFGLAHNSFNSGEFNFLNADSLVETDNLRYSSSTVNVIYRGKKTGNYYGFNAEFFRLDGESVIALGVGIGNTVPLRDNEKETLEFRYSAGINGASTIFAVSAALLDIEFKIPPAKGVLGTSIIHTKKEATWGYRGVNAGLDVVQGLTYGANTYVRLGTELGLLRFLWLRSGFYLERGVGNDLFYGPTAGLGLDFPISYDDSNNALHLKVDWAVFPYPTFQDSFVLPNQQPIALPNGSAQIISLTFYAQL